MAKPSLEPIQIFRPGRHVAANGVAIEFTQADLQATAGAYDPTKHEAPLVVGHPKHDAPAYGWVKSLGFSEGALAAQPDQVDPAFGEMVVAGRFKKVSASFYTPDAPQNPVSGVYYLRHIGFLGAQPPAVKGLRSPAFTESEAGVIEFADWGDVQNASLWRRMRDWFIGEKGLAVADSIIPDYAVAAIEEAARATDTSTAGMSPAYSEITTGVTMTPEQIAAQKAALDATAAEQARVAAEQTARAAEFAEREGRITAAEAARARTEIAEFVEGLVKAGKVLPAHKAGLIAFMAGIAGAQVVEFGEGDKAVKKPGAAWLREYLAAQPKQVEFREIGTGDGSEAAGDDAQSIANRALEFQESERAAGREISATAAVTHVTQGAN